ncbi:DUF4232 domain-containing protein [Acetobacter farinalis]|uniref:DUF4232 domain-containing protein n=1 Tax=Acetobacter farinalis TaxID=1260984 RepID=A0ABT3Q7Z1_9PROT|nr:DUF4232 domain-containing protein [Acetobacter farinalis]MCX2561390.1 DUF4232 domain-containing protein [Acetobacter farinalis]NHO30588.1 DUF4232 domain-containing protein [Acetobacter farinalis]
MRSLSSFYQAGFAWVGLVGCLLASPACAAGEGPVQPSEAELKAVHRQIAAIRNPQDRAAVQQQSLVWQMTTFLCQSAARKPLERLGAGSRFFLQDGKPDSQVLVSPALLQGRGQFRQAGSAINWTPFQWSCHLDPATGFVEKFEATPLVGAVSNRQVSACQPGQLAMALDDRNGAFNGMSHSGTALTLRNTSPEACAMPPVLSLRFEDAAGHALPVARRAYAAARRPGPHGPLPRQQSVPVILPAGAVREATLRWVSGDVYDDSHNCVRPSWLVLKAGEGDLRTAFHGQFCAPARSALVFDQSALGAHTDAQ